MHRYLALLPAAGVGARMGATHPKQYLDIRGHPMLWHAIRAFEQHPLIARIHVVLAPEDGWWERYDWSAFAKLTVSRRGGGTRAESVRNGLADLAGAASRDDWVLVHDAARPCLTRALLDKLVAELGDDPVGGILAVPVADTLKREGPGGHIAETVPRTGLWAAQTPQMFRLGQLHAALEMAGNQVTDEASALECLGLKPRLVESDPGNLKVTFPKDLEMASLLLAG